MFLNFAHKLFNNLHYFWQTFNFLSHQLSSWSVDKSKPYFNCFHWLSTCQSNDQDLKGLRSLLTTLPHKTSCAGNKDYCQWLTYDWVYFTEFPMLNLSHNAVFWLWFFFHSRKLIMLMLVAYLWRCLCYLLSPSSSASIYM